jgi:hypothetical protein
MRQEASLNAKMGAEFSGLVFSSRNCCRCFFVSALLITFWLLLVVFGTSLFLDCFLISVVCFTSGGFRNITFVGVSHPPQRESEVFRLRLTISSWLDCSWIAKAVLFLNKSHHLTRLVFVWIEQVHGSGRFQLLGDLPITSYGRPLVRDWFVQGLKHVDTDYVCMINGDVMVPQAWFDRAADVCTAMSFGFTPILIANRIDIDLLVWSRSPFLITKREFMSEVQSLAKRHRWRKSSVNAVDAFVFRCGTVSFSGMPSLLVGKYFWDNWMTCYLNQAYDVVTLLWDPPLFHLPHPETSRSLGKDQAFDHNWKLLVNSSFRRCTHSFVHWVFRDGRVFMRGTNRSLPIIAYQEAKF